KLEEHRKYDHDKLSIKNYQTPLLYDSKTEKETIALDRIKEANIDEMSPLEAMNLLDELKRLLRK
ncbi:MAG: hypothetical protein WCS78_04945, partial [Bacilli bacterium]